MKQIAVLMLLVTVGVRAQTTCPSRAWVGTRCLPFCDQTDGFRSCAVRPAPLQCAKYQHFVAAHEEDCSTNMIGCTRQVPDSCEENIHWVTEREWQDLQTKLKELQPKK